MSTKYQLTDPHQNLQIGVFSGKCAKVQRPKPESLWSLLILVGATCPVSYVPTNTALRQSTTDNRDQQLQSAVDKNRNQQSEEAVKKTINSRSGSHRVSGTSLAPGQNVCC